jgi:hypothetical protein
MLERWRYSSFRLPDFLLSDFSSINQILSSLSGGYCNVIWHYQLTHSFSSDLDMVARLKLDGVIKMSTRFYTLILTIR